MSRLHPREEIVNNARTELSALILKWDKKHDGLTVAEYLQIISGVSSEKIATVLKYEIREERHPDNPDKPGGLA